jgi:hypothetical protein
MSIDRMSTSRLEQSLKRYCCAAERFCHSSVDCRIGAGGGQDVVMTLTTVVAHTALIEVSAVKAGSKLE